MIVKDLMSRDVVSVTPLTSLKHVAQLLTAHRISGMPVLGDAGEVVGVVSEADILVAEQGESPSRRWLGPLLGAADTRGARTVADAMTAPAITIGEHSDVTEAARRMTEDHVNRLPVLDWSGALVGIVTRADLVRAFARADAVLEEEIRKDIVARVFWMDETAVDVRVERGEVELEGHVEQRFDAELLARLVRRVPGVVAVRSSLTWQYDERDASPPDTLHEMERTWRR